MPDVPPLLKERRHLRKEAAEQLWRSLQTQGWKRADPLWGAAAALGLNLEKVREMVSA